MATVERGPACHERAFEGPGRVRRALRRGALALLALAGVLLGGFLLWALTPAGPMPQALDALISDDAVRVTEDVWWTFAPATSAPVAGVVLYPGGRVDPRSYAPAARALAERGHLAVIVPMPLNLAVFAPERAAEVIAAHPEIRRWAVGGHSLGGAMAARFVHDKPEAADALFLWAAYPAGSDDLSARPLSVASIYGSLDGVATPAQVRAAAPLLPAETDWVSIEGGNHAGFGWYGPQRGDGVATVSREAQQAQAVAATADLLQSIPE